VIGLPVDGLPSRPATAAEKRKLTSIDDFNRCVDAHEASPEVCLDLLRAFVKGKPGERSGRTPIRRP